MNPNLERLGERSKNRARSLKDLYSATGEPTELLKDFRAQMKGRGEEIKIGGWGTCEEVSTLSTVKTSYASSAANLDPVELDPVPQVSALLSCGCGSLFIGIDLIRLVGEATKFHGQELSAHK
jgi:phage tail tube protein FII